MAITGRFDADFQPFLDAVQQANKSLDNLDQTAKDVSAAVDKVGGQSLTQIIAESDLLHDAIEKALEVAKELAAYFPELAERGAVVNDVADAFTHLTEQAGLTADVLLGDLRAGTHGTVDDFALMQRANQDLAAGLNLTEDQFGTLNEAAYALAKATGTDVTAALNTMSDAMVTGRAKGLQLLTGKIDLKKAEDDYAASLEGTGRELTAEGKLEVDRQTIFAAVTTGLERLGTQQDSLKDQVDQAQTAWKNFEDELGRVIAKSPVLNSGLDAMRNALINAFGGDQETAIKNIAKAIDEAGIIVVDFGLAVVAVATPIHEAWSLIETLVLGVTTTVAGAVDFVLEGWTKLAQGANAVSSHIVSDQTVAAMVEVRTQLRGATADLAAQTEEAAKGVKGQSSFDQTLAKLGGTLFNTRDAMVAAQTAMDTHTDAATKNSTAVDKAGTSQQGLNDQVVPATEYTKQYVAAWEELNKTGVDYQATVDQINPKLVEQIQYYLQAGASVKTLAEAYPQVGAAGVAAIDAIQKKSSEASTSITKIWNDYTDVVGTGSATAYEKAEAAIDKWYADDLAKHQASKTDTQAYYDAIAALDDAKYAQLKANRVADDVDSLAHLQAQAKRDQEAYTFAMANADQFSQEVIDKRRATAQASADAVQNFWVQPVLDADKAVAASAATSAAAVGQSWIAGQKEILDHSMQSLDQRIALTDKETQAQITAVKARAAATIAAGQGAADSVTSMMNQTINYLVSEAERYQHSWAGVMDQTVVDARHSAGEIQFASQGAAIAMSAALKEVDATNIGQMMKQGTQSIDLMNQYEAAIEAAMANLGFGIGGVAPARAAGGPVSAGAPYLVGEAGPELFVPSSGGTIVPNGGGMAVTINVTQPLGTPSQIAAAVSSALADAMRRSGVRMPSQ